MAYQLAGDSNKSDEMVPKLLLPLSADIAHLFRGVAHEMAHEMGRQGAHQVAQDRSSDVKDEEHFQGEARARGGSQVRPRHTLHRNLYGGSSNTYTIKIHYKIQNYF